MKTYRAIEAGSLYFPLALMPIIFFLPPSPGIYIFGVTQLLLDILFLNGPHPVLTYFQIFTNPVFKKTIREYERESPNIATYIAIGGCLLLVFNCALPVLTVRAGPGVMGLRLFHILILTGLVPTFYHILWQIRGISLSYNAAYLKSNSVGENILKHMRKSQQIERRVTPALFLLLLIQFFQFIYKIPAPTLKVFVYFGYAAAFLFILYTLWLLPSALRYKKGIFLARLMALPFSFATVWVYFFFKTTHSIEYISVVSRTQAASSVKPVFFARAALVAALIGFIILGNAGPIFFGFNYNFLTQMTPLLVLAFALDSTLTQIHIIFDILLYRMRSQWVREAIGPLVTFGIDLNSVA